MQTGTLEDVKERGYLKFGVKKELIGFSKLGDDGIRRGFDADTCRTVAAAVLGDATRVKFFPSSGMERFAAVKSGEVDMISFSATLTLSRDTVLGLNWAGISYYDGQGFGEGYGHGCRGEGRSVGAGIDRFASP